MRINQALGLTRTLVGLDLETTGLSKHDRIVQLALEVYAPDKPIAAWKTLINPEMPIPPEVSEVHGIYDRDVRTAPTFAQIAPKIVNGLTGCDFSGKNIKRFDLPFIKREFARVGYADWTYEGAAILDVDRLWQMADPRRLGDAVKAWATIQDNAEVGTLDAHDALSDVVWSNRVAANMINALEWNGKSAQDVYALCYPDDYDVEGKMRWLQCGELCLNFSEHRDIPLSKVDRGFLRWMLGPKADFSVKVKEAVRQELNGYTTRREPRLAGMAEPL